VFADRYGESLGDVCARLMDKGVQSVDTPVEGLGHAESITGDIGTSGLTGRLASRADRSLDRARRQDDEADAESSVVVLGSGNLGLLYRRDPRRSTLEDLDEEWPALVPGLTAHPGIAFVGGIDRDGRCWAVGRAGRRDLDTGEVTGSDPLAGFGEHAPRMLRRALRMPEAPDLYVNSVQDPVTGDVAAFEDLVGSHGGLGGSQDQAVLLGPSDLMSGLPARIEGADALHRVLVGMLEACGQRSGAPAGEVTHG
jgi:hypothetical protein